jgi:hypothetical protein
MEPETEPETTTAAPTAAPTTTAPATTTTKPTTTTTKPTTTTTTTTTTANAATHPDITLKYEDGRTSPYKLVWVDKQWGDDANNGPGNIAKGYYEYQGADVKDTRFWRDYSFSLPRQWCGFRQRHHATGTVRHLEFSSEKDRIWPWFSGDKK